ncbi:MAG: RNA methyltransferase [Spirochaetes bacterium]|nr:RNA methyltransferase [Spirochaetota bacterium]
MRKLSFEEITAQRKTIQTLAGIPRFPIAVVLENIRSLYNVGSIFRTSDGAGIEKLYICGYTACPPRKEIEKTALGSTESVPWEWRSTAREAIEELKLKNYSIVVLEHTDSSIALFNATFKYPLCLVIGNEVEGVSQQTIDLCDMAIEIPMHGIKHSLNVSVAYGIAVYGILERYLLHAKNSCRE